MNVQVRLYEWGQADGGDRLTPTGDLVPSIGIVSIPPGETQLVRLVRLRPEAPERELSYRALVDELPAPAESRDGVQFLLRYSIPLFVLPPGTTPRLSAGASRKVDPASLSASVREQDGRSWLVVENRGPQRLRLSQLALVDPAGGRTTLVEGLVGYVLAGRTRRWPLPVPVGALQRGVLRAKLNDDPEEQALPMDEASL